MSTELNLSSHLTHHCPPRNNLTKHINQSSSNNNLKQHSNSNNLNKQQRSLGSRLNARRNKRINLFQKEGGEDQEKTQALQKTRSSKWSPDGHARAQDKCSKRIQIIARS
jgi:hypothetical protein